MKTPTARALAAAAMAALLLAACATHGHTPTPSATQAPTTGRPAQTPPPTAAPVPSPTAAPSPMPDSGPATATRAPLRSTSTPAPTQAPPPATPTPPSTPSPRAQPATPWDAALELHRLTVAAQQDPLTANVILSPHSIRSALALAWAGAAGETADQMQRALAFAPGRQKEAQRQAALSAAIAKHQDPDFELSTANAVWAQTGHPLNQDYLQLLQDGFAAPAARTDFRSSPEQARASVNRWSAEHTKDKIREILPPGSVTADTRVILANAVYMKALWAVPFEVRRTRDLPFHNSDGTTASVPMMSQQERMEYGQSGTRQVLRKTYAQGQADMVIILPPQGELDALEAGLGTTQLQEMLASLRWTDVDLLMPRFKLKTGQSLSPVLKKMGITHAFSGRTADFSGIDGARCADQPLSCLKVDNVLHKATVEVDEEGTVAAATTAVTMTTESMPQYQEFRADRPFMFLIMLTDPQTILFTGRVAKLPPGG